MERSYVRKYFTCRTMSSQLHVLILKYLSVLRTIKKRSNYLLI